MHLYFISRGVQHQVDLWKTIMQSQFYRWKRKNLKTGKDQIDSVQGALRPVQFWEYVFPEEHLINVIGNMGLSPIPHPAISKYARIIRKVLKLEPIPQIDLEKFQKDRIMKIFGVSVHPIGIKKDEKRDIDFGKSGRFHQEAL